MPDDRDDVGRLLDLLTVRHGCSIVLRCVVVPLHLHGLPPSVLWEASAAAADFRWGAEILAAGGYAHPERVLARLLELVLERDRRTPNAAKS